MLHIIGIGAKKEHINHEMLDVIQGAKEVFLEYYTSFYDTPFEELEQYLDKKITIVDREVIESKVEETILNPSAQSHIALLVLGDPLIATTHTDLMLRAKEKNIETKVYNNVSIANQIGKTGLQFYKFGKITSIPFFNEKFMPRTPYLVHHDNHKMGAHSLFLLDLNPSNDIANKGHDKYLTAHRALQFLLDIPKLMLEHEEIEEKDAQYIDENTPTIICSQLGFKGEKIMYGTISELIALDKLAPLPCPLCVIIPGDLHEMEELFLEQFKILGTNVGVHLE